MTQQHDNSNDAARLDARKTAMSWHVSSVDDNEMLELETLRADQLARRHDWARHASASKWCYVQKFAGGSVVTHCHGRFATTERYEVMARPPSADRCEACQQVYAECRRDRLALEVFAPDTVVAPQPDPPSLTGCLRELAEATPQERPRTFLDDRFTYDERLDHGDGS